jgi:hypothetical protein
MDARGDVVFSTPDASEYFDVISDPENLNVHY